MNSTFATKVIAFNHDLEKMNVHLPAGYQLINPYIGDQQVAVNQLMTTFYQRYFYLGFVCPLGIARLNDKGHLVNCNYYENKVLQSQLMPLIVKSLRQQLDFGVDTSICYCIGSGENYRVLMQLNDEYHFFNQIIPLEHPRFITQYHPKDRNLYLEKYLTALKNG